jgi:hypothetical protein
MGKKKTHNADSQYVHESNVAPAPPKEAINKVQVEVEKMFKCLNPQGEYIPVETIGLSERLDTLDNKTIYICQGEADPVIMPALYKMLQEKYPNTTWIYYDRSDFGPSTPGTGGPAISTGQPEDPDILDKVDAVIRGIDW